MSGPVNWLAAYVVKWDAFGSGPSKIGPGNAFEPMPEWNRVTGGWRSERNTMVRRAALACCPGVQAWWAAWPWHRCSPTG